MSLLELGWLGAAVCVLVPLSMASCADDIKYGVGTWPEELGNHRAVVRVTSKADAVWAHVEWRRHDANPRDKAVLVYDAASDSQVKNALVVQIGKESGNIVFQPEAPGDYYIYYMPNTHNPSQSGWATTYTPPKDTADPAWRGKVGGEAWKSLPKAQVVEFQARGEFHRFDPMEIIATQDEVTELLKKNPFKSYLLFPEDRRFPIKMTGFLPKRWIESGPAPEFHGEARKGEFYTFQIGLYAARAPVADLEVAGGELKSDTGGVIPASNLRCFNLRGIDCLGRLLKKKVAAEVGQVRALWFGLEVPSDTPAGRYVGNIVVKPKGTQETWIKIALDVTDPALEDGGDSELWRMSRLRWLDSTIGLDETPTAPYTPVKSLQDRTQVLGRDIRFGNAGLPESIKSGAREILAGPVAMVVATAEGESRLDGRGAGKVLGETAARVARENSGMAGVFSAKCWSQTEFDGYINYRIVLKATKQADIRNIRLEIPIKRDVATYMMGLGRKGGYRPKEWQWKWDPGRANNTLWIGDADAGLYCKLKLTIDAWDIYALSSLPKSWANDGKGGCEVVEEGDAVIVRAYSGERAVKAGEEIEFRFGLLVTPVKPLDQRHWDWRYYHFYKEVPKPGDIAKTGATIVNIHQGNALNPNINYPFLQAGKLADYVKQLHNLALKAKIYYTVRELSNYVAEMWPLRSLGDEVFVKGSGGGHSWLIEHLGTDYAPAWHDPLSDGSVDAAIATTGLSRWHNYYLEGLSWLIKNVGIDGLYLDGIGYDREIMKRVRRVMDQAILSSEAYRRTGCLIDFHSGNEFPFNDMRISPACKYMEHFPYIDSLWFGEGYDSNETPDYWLVEVSGIPFGLYGEMLQDGGNPWRGMIYGMSNRLGWQGDPRAIWKVWDDFGIKDSKMIGYWDPACPVKTGNKDVLATVYVKPGKALISIASWAKDPVKIKLTLDWKTLGLDIRKADLSAPAIPGFQEAADFQWSGEIPVEPGKGWLLVLEER